MDTLRRVLGVELDEVSWREKAVSLAGGLVALLAVTAVSRHALGLAGAPALVASMGASAVLLFGVPHGALSQPWPLVAGHVVSALIGVTCGKLIGNVELAGAVAVGLAIGAMHQLRAIHPPGGATALTAVVAGPAVRELGYSFVWRPVLLNALTLAVVAVVFNAAFPWRRYPARLARRPVRPAATRAVTHAEVVAALRSIDSFVDITEDDLLRLHRVLSQPSPDPRPTPPPQA